MNSRDRKHPKDEPAPETHNSEQADAPEQAQTVASHARSRAAGTDGESERVNSGIENHDAQDVVDHMKQMDRGGKIDMAAYRGEPNHDDNVDKYGKQAKVDDLRGDGT